MPAYTLPGVWLPVRVMPLYPPPAFAAPMMIPYLLPVAVTPATLIAGSWLAPSQ